MPIETIEYLNEEYFPDMIPKSLKAKGSAFIKFADIFLAPSMDDRAPGRGRYVESFTTHRQ